MKPVNNSAIKLLFLFVVVTTSLLGGLFLILPGLTLLLFGATRGASAEFFVRSFGASLVYVAVVSFVHRDVDNPSAARTLMLGNIVEDSILAIIFASAASAGTTNVLGWLFALIFAAVAIVNVALLPSSSGR